MLLSVNSGPWVEYHHWLVFYKDHSWIYVTFMTWCMPVFNTNCGLPGESVMLPFGLAMFLDVLYGIAYKKLVALMRCRRKRSKHQYLATWKWKKYHNVLSECLFCFFFRWFPDRWGYLWTLPFRPLAWSGTSAFGVHWVIECTNKRLH